MTERDRHGREVGTPVPDWTPPERPTRETIRGGRCRLEPLDAGRHAPPLLAAFDAAPDDRDWTWLADERPRALPAFRDRLERHARSADPLFFAVVPAGGEAAGLAALLRIDPATGTIEIGHLHFAPALQRRPAATEAVLLLGARAFALGFRRLEWKCDALNRRSREAAARLGFTFEGVFRQAAVVRGRNRDTAWYSITDGEWPDRAAAMRAWLDPSNFGPDGAQRRRLAAIRAAAGPG